MEPPRGRGKVPPSTPLCRCGGGTPAWAGKRFWNRPWVWATSDHPRVGGEKALRNVEGNGMKGSPPQCGEKMGRFSCTNSVPGSPPRRRGKGNQQQRRPKAMRIPPAQAGKSAWRSVKTALCWDHPRVGGEKSFAATPGTSTTGSPPRGRGKGNSFRTYPGRWRITPA